ncbi:MAG: methylmalonyl Co-A mutase-associated GTPase MeaB [Bacteroidales bacterium]|nr:methylmalonyl Co-A mutase-associated GTPase MeaB [Bacteroidales bacterium]
MEKQKRDIESALKVNQGIEQPPSVSPESARRFLNRQQSLPNAETCFKGIRNGDRTILSKAITMVESSNLKHQKIAQQIIEKCLPYSGKSIRIGITGVPGVGKSTFIEAFGKHLTKNGYKLAVLAIDPSSNIRRGSILGDKTRMEELSVDQNAFIRPSPSAGTLGGVAQKTRESIILCETAGFNVIFVETVGVGQSEVAVHSMVDFFLLLMLAGAGDELQGIKRGIMEMADAILINKADGDNIQRAKLAKAEYANALHLFPPTESGWEPKATTVSAIDKSGMDEVWQMILKYRDLTDANGYFLKRRNDQQVRRMLETLEENLLQHFYSNEEVKENLPTIKEQLLDNKLSSFMAAKKLLDQYFKK